MKPRKAARAQSVTPPIRSLMFFEPPLPLNWMMASEYSAAAWDLIAAFAISTAPSLRFWKQ